MAKLVDGAQAASKILKHLKGDKYSTVAEVIRDNPELKGGEEYLKKAMGEPPVSGSVLQSRF